MKHHHTLAAFMAVMALSAAQHALSAEKDEVARGGYLVTAMGCSDCHTPLKMGPKGPQPDFSRGLSGHPQGTPLPPAPAPVGPWIWGGAATNTAFYGPWGISLAANLTPDVQTGIGNWTADQFVTAMRTGMQKGTGRPLAAPMPWPAIGKLTDADLRAMFAYLKAQPAVRNEVGVAQGPQARK